MLRKRSKTGYDDDGVKKVNRNMKGNRIKTLLKKCNELQNQFQLNIALIIYDQATKTITEYNSDKQLNVKYFNDLLEDLKQREVYQGEFQKGRGFHNKFKHYIKHQVANFDENNEEASLSMTLIKSSAQKTLKETLVKPSKLLMMDSSVQDVEQGQQVNLIAPSDKINTSLSL